MTGPVVVNHGIEKVETGSITDHEVLVLSYCFR
jgi:hypothetical protein